jgi:hypothetical protein
MTPDDRGPVIFVDMVLVLLEDQFPWLATDSHDAISGADTVDQLIKLHVSLLRQPTARGRYSPSAAPKGRPHNDQRASPKMKLDPNLCLQREVRSATSVTGKAFSA